MKITDDRYFDKYQAETGSQIREWFDGFDFQEKRIDVGYNTKASAVYSSNIEGNPIDVNSFMNSMLAEKNIKPQKDIQEIQDLILAYEFAQSNSLNQHNFLLAHKTMSQTLLIKDKRGKYRTDKMGVFDDYGLIYLAVEPEFVKEKMSEFFEDIQLLVKEDLSLEQAFYHASLIHLIFVHIHPFWDGNGRSARLLEKWFLSEKINSRAWKLQSEKYYKENLADYYDNINLGVNYYELNYDRCMPFLKMLPASLQQS